MKLTKLLTCFIVINCSINTLSSQTIDHYGLRLGLGVSNQIWNYDFTTLKSGWMQNKPGFSGHLFAEKKFNDRISIRPEIGYVQKGFADPIIYTDEVGESLEVPKKNLILHNLSADIKLKCNFSSKAHKIKPYMSLGFRGDYLLGYRDIHVELNNTVYGIYFNVIDNFNKFAVGGLVGLGISINELMVVDLELNPTISKNYNNGVLTIRDFYYGVTAGLNINKLLQKSEG